MPHFYASFYDLSSFILVQIHTCPISYLKRVNYLSLYFTLIFKIKNILTKRQSKLILKNIWFKWLCVLKCQIMTLIKFNYSNKSIKNLEIYFLKELISETNITILYIFKNHYAFNLISYVYVMCDLGLLFLIELTTFLIFFNILQSSFFCHLKS